MTILNGSNEMSCKETSSHAFHHPLKLLLPDVFGTLRTC